MAGRAEDLFTQLRDAASVLALIGEAEDAHLDCKEWPQGDEAQKMLAKATCGLANADGGVLVIGMKAESVRNDEPDVVTAAVPVSNTSLVKSRVLDLVGKLVEPGIVGLEVREIDETPGSQSGFVIVYVPRTEGNPHRSRKDWRFYQRIGSTTLAMDYWQIEAMFGTRPHPHLELYLEEKPIEATRLQYRQPNRLLAFGISNLGRGVARFPSLRFKAIPGIGHDAAGLDGSGETGLPKRASSSDWIVFRGGVDDVIYPGETRQIGNLIQAARATHQETPMPHVWLNSYGPAQRHHWTCDALTIVCEISAEGVQTNAIERVLTQEDYTVDVAAKAPSRSPVRTSDSPWQ